MVSGDIEQTNSTSEHVAAVPVPPLPRKLDTHVGSFLYGSRICVVTHICSLIVSRRISISYISEVNLDEPTFGWDQGLIHEHSPARCVRLRHTQGMLPSLFAAYDTEAEVAVFPGIPRKLWDV